MTVRAVAMKRLHCLAVGGVNDERWKDRKRTIGEMCGREPIVRDIEVKGVLTQSNLPMADGSVSPPLGRGHGCKYCYASIMKRFSNHSKSWGEFVDVKHWPPVKNPRKYEGKALFTGSVTDLYRPLEEKYGRTRALLLQMQGSGCTVGIATKSDLALRDLD